MSSLTPGLLVKLLENAGNKDVRVTGEHRSALLQVLEILPSLSGADEPWQSRGFFLKVSDSLHSAYVSIQDEDMDLIYSDKIQLGQFVYISRLDSGSPVPVLRGLKPIPKRRPCVGNPKDLLSSDLLPIKKNIKFSREKLQKMTAIDSKERLELRRLSLDSARRIWHQNPKPKSSSTGSDLSSKPSMHVHPRKKASSKNDSSLKSSVLSISPLKSKNGVSSPKAYVKPLKKDFNSTIDHITPTCLVKVPLSTKTPSDRSISCDTLPPAIHTLGKVIMHHRNVASLAAASALEEASAAESVILCLQAFAELISSSQNMSSGQLVEQYLDFHQNIQRAAMVANSLLSTSLLESKSSFNSGLQCPLPDACKTKTNKNAASWVHAAMETNLSQFTLFKKLEKGEENCDKCHYVILESVPKELNSENQSPQNKQSPRSHGNLLVSPKQATSLKRHPSAVKMTNSKRDRCLNGSGLKETTSLAEKLVLHSRAWFLKYMENALNGGFRFCTKEGSEIARLLRQLKRVNQWLDDLGGGGKIDGRIEDLRKKLYGFLLEHVDTAVAPSE